MGRSLSFGALVTSKSLWDAGTQGRKANQDIVDTDTHNMGTMSSAGKMIPFNVPWTYDVTAMSVADYRDSLRRKR